MKNKLNLILIGFLLLTAFLLASLLTKVQKLEEKEKVALVANEHFLSEESLKTYAKELGLDTKRFGQCLKTQEKRDRVSQDVAYGESLGVRGTPAFFIGRKADEEGLIINGRFLGGAFPFETFKEIIDKEIKEKGSSNVSSYSKNLQDAAKKGSFDPKEKEVKIEKDDSLKGNPAAKVTIVEFSDFECPFCGRAASTVKKILEEYKDEVRIVYKQFPLVSIHKYAQKAAEASLCALDQGKFWEYHDKLFENQPDA